MKTISENTFELIFENVSEGIFVVDENAKFVRCNEAFKQIVLFNKEEIKKKRFDEIFYLETKFNVFFNKIKINSESVQNIEFSNKINDKKNINLRIIYLNEDNNLVFFVNNTLDHIKNVNNELSQNYQLLKESEAKFRNLFLNIPLGIFTVNKDGTIESINPFMLKILGSTSINKSLSFNINEIPNLKGTELLKDINTCFDNGKSIQNIYEYTSFWDKNIYFKAYITPIDNEAREKLIIIIDDKTEDKFTKNQLRILSEGVDNSSASIVVTDTEGIIQFVNKQFIELTGYSRKEALGKKINILKSGFHSKEFYDDLWETITKGKQWLGEFKNKKKNGELFWESAMISALKNDKGELTNYMAIKEDVTEKKKIEKKLKDRTEQLLTLINQTPDIIIFKDYKGRWVLANEIAIKLYGLENVSFYNKTDSDLINITTKFISEFENNIKTDKLAWEKASMISFDEIFYSIDGKEKVFEVIKLPIYNDDGTKKALLTFGRNITKRRKSEIELKYAKEKAEEADLLKSSFLANMSHEIRTPLNGIIGFSTLLKEYNLKKEDKNKFIDIIISNSNQLITIIDDILLISKLQVNQIKVSKSEFSLSLLLKKVLNEFSTELNLVPEKNVVLKINKLNDKEDVKILTDKNKLQLIFSKLIINAIKFTTKGEIVFGCDIDKNKNIVFFVKDTGVGISKEKQHIIFKKFRQADDSTIRPYGGTGLGLSIVKGVIDLLEGELWLESELNKGSKFLFTLPIDKKNELKIKVKKNQLYSKWDKLKILIVDDVEESRILLEEILIPTKAKLFKAKNGKEAIDIFIKNQDIDIVLMDIQLPEINGFDAAKRIKGINSNVKIVAQTAYANQGYEQESIKYKCDDFISKPIIASLLLDKISNLLYI